LSEKSDLDLKGQVFIINKLAKEDKYRQAEYMEPVWDSLGHQYSEYKNLLRLQKE
jgi:hypothetical protein